MSRLSNSIAQSGSYLPELVEKVKNASSLALLIQQRFKGVGMRWSKDGFKHLLHLRLAWVNGRFGDLFALAIPPN